MQPLISKLPIDIGLAAQFTTPMWTTFFLKVAWELCVFVGPRTIVKPIHSICFSGQTQAAHASFNFSTTSHGSRICSHGSLSTFSCPFVRQRLIIHQPNHCA